MFDDRPEWVTRAARLVPRLLNAAFEELQPLSPHKAVADAAAHWLPQHSFNRTRTALLRAAGIRIAAGSQIQGPITITGVDTPYEQLSFGARTLVSGRLHVDLGAKVTIGNGVRIGHDVSLLTVSHEIGAQALRAGARQARPIAIGDGAWLASRVIVLGGVSIGAGAIVAAGAVVTRSVAPNTLVAGVPARVVRTLD